MRAMLVTAGFGTRLAPLTDLLPKPAVWVANKPVAWFALDHLQRCGIREVVLNTHHLARELEQAIRAAAPNDIELSFVHEPEILGTGGGVHNAWKPIAGETFVVMNGKYVFAPDIAAALRLHRDSGAIATMIVKSVAADDPLGAIEIDDDGRVRRMLREGDPIAGLRPSLYTGVSLFDARAHRDLPESGDLIRTAYRRWLARGERVMAYVDTASWRDVGMSLEHYWEANIALATGAARWPGIEPSSDSNVIAADARIEDGARVSNSVVGARVQVAAGVNIDRCVVWPGTRVQHDLSNAIALPGGEPLSIVATSALYAR